MYLSIEIYINLYLLVLLSFTWFYRLIDICMNLPVSGFIDINMNLPVFCTCHFLQLIVSFQDAEWNVKLKKIENWWSIGPAIFLRCKYLRLALTSFPEVWYILMWGNWKYTSSNVTSGTQLDVKFSCDFTISLSSLLSLQYRFILLVI